jgi:NAD+ synthetase
VNQVGGNDDLIFPGRSLVLDPRGRVVKQGPSFAEGLIVFDTEDRQESLEVEESPKPAEAFNAVVLGTRDYVYKTGFSKVLLGLSGGVDSALCAVVAVEALGQENVLPVLLPSAYTSRESLEDAQALIQNLGLNYEVLAIDGLLAGYESVLSPVFADSKQDVTEENIQARVRGDLLMAMANKFGALLLATGNKSELAVGYCTLYGDMCGALGVIADMPKTLVYEVCQWLNSELGGLIPERILHKPPSAELRPGQKDTDNLPDYQILDAILDLLIDKHYSSQQCVEAGHAPDLVRMVHDLVCRAEFKRRQAPPGLKITDRAFGTGWRMPLAASWPGDL